MAWYDAPQVDWSALSDIPKMWREGKEWREEQDLNAARKKAFSSGVFDPQTAVQQLLAFGDVEGASKAASIAKALRPEGLTPYQSESLAIQRERMAKEPQLTPYQAESLELKRRELGQKQEGGRGRRDALANELARLKDTALNLKKHPGLGRSVGGGGPGGLYPRSELYTIPGSDPANFEAQFENLKSQVGFNVLQAMRNASQTGGALGQVAVQELVMLQNNLAALDPKQSPEAFEAQLQKIADYADQVTERLNKAVEAEGGGTPPVAPRGIPTLGDPGASAPATMTIPRGAPQSGGTGIGPGLAVQAGAVYSPTGQARPMPSPDKIQLLRQYANDPEAIAAFDELYGPGAADHFLQGGR